MRLRRFAQIRLWFSLLVVITFGLVGMIALFHPGFYTSHDGWHNIARLFHFHEAINDGQIPPRWIGNLAHGFGYPLFVFSYHAPWLIAELFMRAGVSVIDSVKLVLVVGFIVSGIVMFFWIRDMFGTWPAVVAGIVYMWTPYRFAKIFVGASVGEATAFLFLPLLFWGLYRLSKTPTAFWIGIGALGLAGTILSHLMLLPLLSFGVAMYLLWLFLHTVKRKVFVISVLLLGLWGLALSSYYLLPALVYSSLIKATTQTGGFANIWQNHLVNFSQLLYSKWGYGPIVSRATEGAVSFQVGIAQWLAFILTAAFMGVYLFKRPILIFKRTIFSRRNRDIAFIGSLTFTITVLAMTTSTLQLWQLLGRYIILDFPWRLLSFTTLWGTMLVGFIVYAFSDWGKLLGVLLIVTALYTNRNHNRVNEYTDIPLSLYIASETTTNTYNEYLPKWAGVDIGKENLPLVDSQEISAHNIERNSYKISFDVTLESHQDVKVNYLYFPDQTVFVDNQQTPFEYKSDGRIVVPVGQGTHQIKIVYNQTPLMKLTNGISLISLLLFLPVLYREKNRLYSPSNT